MGRGHGRRCPFKWYFGRKSLAGPTLRRASTSFASQFVNRSADAGPAFDRIRAPVCQPRLRRLERVNGIEPSSSAWKAVALPLSYTREVRFCSYSSSSEAAIDSGAMPVWLLLAACSELGLIDQNLRIPFN